MARTITPQELIDFLASQKQITLVDVRSPKEFGRWSLYNSINIPLASLAKKARALSKTATVVVYCNHGNDSKKAASLLAGKGVQALSLTGGLKAWNTMYDFVPIEEKHSTLTFYQCKRLGKGCLSYVVVLPDNKSAIIIDPTYHINTYISFLKKNGWKAITILDTHIHADHVSGGKKLAKKLGVPYLLPKASEVEFPFKPLEDELPKLAVGASITCIQTPGHTKEAVSIIFDELFLVSGDTLFVDAVSRTDHGENLKESSAALYDTITKKLFKLKDRIHVLPAHTTQPMIPGPLRTATLRYVKLFNPIKEFTSPNELVEYIQKMHQSDPPNYKDIRGYNRGGSIPRDVDVDEIELGGNFCAIAQME